MAFGARSAGPEQEVTIGPMSGTPSNMQAWYTERTFIHSFYSNHDNFKSHPGDGGAP
jgi:hypothetical protein